MVDKFMNKEKIHIILNKIKSNWRIIFIIIISITVAITTIFFILNFSPLKIIFNNNDKYYKKNPNVNLNKKSKEDNNLKTNENLNKFSTILVQTSKVQKKDVPVYINALGTVTPIESVTVKTEINGELLKIFFNEGQLVKQGDILAEIDSKPLKAQYTQYQGQLFKDQAFLTNAKLDLKRYKILYPSGGISKQTLDTQSWLVKQYEGIIQSDKGQLDAVNVNLNHCKIKAPISGKVGLRQVNPGNYVQISDPNGIVIINKIQPIHIVFSISEDYLPQILEKTKIQFKIPTLAFNKEQTEQISSGELVSTDNQIDLNTGTIKLKAQFLNEKQNLFPNQFVNIKLLIETIPEAKIVPISAIQHGKIGDYLFIYENKKARLRKVTTGPTDGDNIVIKSGLNLDEFVIIDGLDKLVDGIEVSVP
jgi:multidrug efflux system membrane fusion protein